MDAAEFGALAERVRRERKRRHWTQQELADRAGVSLGVVNNFERQVTQPQAPHLRAILGALDLEAGAGDELAEQTRRSWPPDVAIFLDVIGLYLVAQPEDRRQSIIFDLTRQIVAAPPD